jgi:hypothetical protein
MEIKVYAPAEQVDPAVDLGALPPPLPEILDVEELFSRRKEAPPQIIAGILHQGCKMVLGGTSKSYKSWCLLDLSVAIASGGKWWGRQCVKNKVIYVNFELPEWAVRERLAAVLAARPECRYLGGYLKIWNLRGHNADLTLLRPILEEQLKDGGYGVIILDPAYKVLGNRDENANGDIAGLMNEFETLGQRCNAAVIVAHHFAKGDSTAKSAMDRMSGAGAWVRDPDTILVATPHEEADCFTVSTILRHLPPVPEFVVEWSFPLMRLALDLDPNSLRRPQSKNKVCTDREFVDQQISETPTARAAIVAAASKLGISRGSADRYLRRLNEAGVIGCGSGLYWKAKR